MEYDLENKKLKLRHLMSRLQQETDYYNYLIEAKCSYIREADIKRELLFAVKINFNEYDRTIEKLDLIEEKLIQSIQNIYSFLYEIETSTLYDIFNNNYINNYYQSNIIP